MAWAMYTHTHAHTHIHTGTHRDALEAAVGEHFYLLVVGIDDVASFGFV